MLRRGPDLGFHANTKGRSVVAMRDLAVTVVVVMAVVVMIVIVSVEIPRWERVGELLPALRS